MANKSMSSSAERAAERIEHIPSCPAGCKLATEEGSFTRKEIIAAIIAEEYAELEQIVEDVAVYGECQCDSERDKQTGDLYQPCVVCRARAAHAEGRDGK